jgi:hypothetical protein
LAAPTIITAAPVHGHQGREAAMMHGLFISTLLATAISLLCPMPANAAEVLLAVLQDKEGKTSLHKITLIDGACIQLLTNFREQAKNDRPIWLTLPQPDFTGMVIEAHCIMPDGSKQNFKAGRPS